jgi:LysM repeat protein
VVQPGDDLWSLAERYYGDGRDWRKIAAANPTVLTGGPDRLQIGWRLKIPDLDDDTSHGDRRMITVRRGDTLSSIAERELGATSRWTEIFRANRSQLSDPDELTVGMRLSLPEQKTSKDTGAAKARDQHREEEASPRRHPPSASPMEPSAPPSLPSAAPSSPSAAPSEAPPDEVPTSTAPAVEVPALSFLGVAGLLAAGVISGLAWRRRLQLQVRPLGRRIVHPRRQPKLSR